MADLIPLRIPAGWLVTRNHFIHVSPNDVRESQDYLDYPFVEDALQFTNARLQLTLDLGWYPGGEPSGQYRLLLVKHNELLGDTSSVADEWEHPLIDYCSRDQALIASKIESILADANNLSAHKDGG